MKPAVIEGARRFGAANFVGGELCLDFVNTVDNWRDPRPGDKLGSPADWLAWCTSARLISESEARTLHRSASNPRPQPRNTSSASGDCAMRCIEW